MSELLPCPFCGGDAYTEIYIVEAAAGCRECQFKVTREHRPYEYDGLPKVIAAWNRRALPAVQPDAREAALREAEKALRKWQAGLTLCGYKEAPITVGMAADLVLDLIDRPAVQPDLTDPVVVHANMLRGTIAKPTLDQIIHLYGVDALCRALVPAICREAALGEMARLGQEFDAALKGETP